ncbi:transcriptional regulator [Yersinia enterocolitica]|uniref:transcriptional regulator n=1 Tax=Yersinia enterocolitica TaxID=630 RepID=UPI003AB304AF
MKLKKYLSSMPRGTSKKLAQQLGISPSHLSQWVTNKTTISPARCIEIEVLTDGVVTRADLRPNDWNSIWPDYQCNELNEILEKGEV